MKGELLGTLQSGQKVYDRPRSHVHTEYPEVWKHVKEVLPRIILDSTTLEYITYTHDFKKEIGKSICVETVDGDCVIYARRPQRHGYTRFVKNRNPESSSLFTIVLKKMREEAYLLVTAYVGSKAPPEPWDKSADESSLPFWQRHALVWSSVPVVEGTETPECPW